MKVSRFVMLSVVAAATSVAHANTKMSLDDVHEEMDSSAIKALLKQSSFSSSIVDNMPELANAINFDGKALDIDVRSLLALNEDSTTYNTYDPMAGCYTNCYSNCHGSRSWR